MKHTMQKHESNYFQIKDVARQWINSVESEKDSFRDKVIYPKIVHWLGSHHSSGILEKILDVGCGQGIASKLMEQETQANIIDTNNDWWFRSAVPSKELAYCGIDGSSYLIKRAKENYPKTCEFMKASVYDMPFEDKYFDRLFSINLIMHLENPESAFDEMSRVLKPGGRFLMITANPTRYSYFEWYNMFIEPVVTKNRIEGKIKIPNATIQRNSIYTHSKNRIAMALGNAFKESRDKSFFVQKYSTTYTITPLRNPKNERYFNVNAYKAPLFCAIEGYKNKEIN